MGHANENFYSELPLQVNALHELLLTSDAFEKVPPGWHVVLTDITDSTQAVSLGRHQEVNLIATGSIVAVLNIAYSLNITVPFFFGGDGATFLVPGSLLPKAMNALGLYRESTLSNFGLSLRTGTVPLSEIYDQGHDIRLAKFAVSQAFSIPVVLGDGLAYAEQLIKGECYLMPNQDLQAEMLDLSGMQCRWDMIPPPKYKDEIVTLLVVAVQVSRQAEAYAKILRKMDELYGVPEKRQPISISKLKLKSTFSRLGAEMRARIGRIRWLELLRNWCVGLYGYFYFRTAKGRNYLKTLVAMSDTLVLDGKINTVICGSAAQRLQLQQTLDKMETAGEILYGLHVSGASIMSCYVRNLEEDHIHFVDGADGGYTMAARILKAKLAKN